MTALLRALDRWRIAGTGFVHAVSSLPRWLRQADAIDQVASVAEDFIGVNVATSDDPRCDDYVVAALRELQIRHVRLSYSYDAVGAASERFLLRLLDEGFDVLLALLPPRQDAKVLARDRAVQARWTEFVTQVLAQHGDRVGAIEIGNTPNRGRWSGYSAQGYLKAWQLAAPVAQSGGKSLAGPNVSDFEPVYNVGFLDAMSRAHSAPDIHTDNLFVERVVEPEAYDHRVARQFATRWLRLNLVKKARVLAEISRQNGISRTYCTYTCWSRKRLMRWSMQPELKNAHYLTRYLVLAAASGALDRVYWGPLICQRDGLIDCGDGSYPDADNVSYYREVRGDVADFTRTAAFSALGFCVRLLRNATCLQAHNDVDGVHHFAFSSPEAGHWHIVWCGDRSLFPLKALYDEEPLNAARFFTPEGQELSAEPVSISEQPLVLRWEQAVAAPEIARLRRMQQGQVPGVVHWLGDQKETRVLQGRAWRGAYSLFAPAADPAPLAAEIPQLLQELPQLKVLRDKRNKLWNVRAPWWSEGEQTVKLNRARGIKRFTYRFLPSKGKRHWNNATQMLRLGINTPTPLGFFEQPGSNAADSYYICRFVEGAFSCRDLFTAFKAGEHEYRGIDKATWLLRIGEFVAHMHWRGIIHRDLSSGNLMMTSANGEITFYLIDIGRALIDRSRAARARMRFKDLNRICYKLAWPDREQLIAAYDANTLQPLPRWWRWSLSSYDWKQNWKKTLKGNKKPKRKKAAPG
jgi:hypothetical protein